MEDLIQLVAECFVRHGIEGVAGRIQQPVEHVARYAASGLETLTHNDFCQSPAEEPTA
jgi:hypothetical protein